VASLSWPARWRRSEFPGGMPEQPAGTAASATGAASTPRIDREVVSVTVRIPVVRTGDRVCSDRITRIEQSAKPDPGELSGTQMMGGYWVVVVLVVPCVVDEVPDGAAVGPFVLVWVLSVWTPLLSVVC